METAEDIQITRYTAYKETGERWLGRVPLHWELTRLGTQFNERRTKVSDKDYPPLSVTKGGIVPQLDDAAKTNDGDNRKLVKKGDFVINSRSDRKASSGLSSLDGSVSLINIVMEPKGVDGRFCEYLLKSNAFIEEFYRNGHGIVADLWTTRYDEMKAIKIALPSSTEQTLITHFLDRKTAQIDKAIAQKEKLIELLKERRQILIHNAVTKGLNPDVKMKDSGVEWIGEIPEHWKVTKLKFASEFVYDGTHGSYPRVENGYRLLSVRNMIDDKFLFLDDDSRIAEKHFKEISSKFQIKENDILLAIVGATLGKVAIVKKCSEPFVTQRSVCTIRVIDARYSNRYLFYFVKSPAFQSYLWINAGFSAQPGVYLGTIQNSYISSPDLKEQNQIASYLDKILSRYDNAISLKEREITKLKEYQSTLVNSTVTGKIKVPYLETLD